MPSPHCGMARTHSRGPTVHRTWITISGAAKSWIEKSPAPLMSGSMPRFLDNQITNLNCGMMLHPMHIGTQWKHEGVQTMNQFCAVALPTMRESGDHKRAWPKHCWLRIEVESNSWGSATHQQHIGRWWGSRGANGEREYTMHRCWGLSYNERESRCSNRYDGIKKK